MWIKQTNEAGQYIDAAGVRCDLISAGVVDLAPVHPEYSERELLAEAMEELGLSLYRPGPKRYSKLRIIEELGEMWPTIRAAMSDTERDKFFGADYLERGREDVESFIAKIAPLVGDIESRLARCEI